MTAMRYLLIAAVVLMPAAAFAIETTPGGAAPSKAPVTEAADGNKELPSGPSQDPFPQTVPSPKGRRDPAAADNPPRKDPAPHPAAYDPFVAAPARLSNGVSALFRFNSLPDTRMSALGTQVSIDPFELSAYKKVGPVSAGVRLPISWNPDRSTDDTILQVVSLDVRAAALEHSFRLYGGLTFDAALNAGAADNKFPNRTVAHTLTPYVITAYAAGRFVPQIDVAWHQAFETKAYAGTFYKDAAKGFALDLVLPYYFPDERLTVLVEFNYGRDTDHGRNRGWVTPGVRFLPAPHWHFGLAVAVPVMDEAFADATGIGVITAGGYEF